MCTSLTSLESIQVNQAYTSYRPQLKYGVTVDEQISICAHYMVLQSKRALAFIFDNSS